MIGLCADLLADLRPLLDGHDGRAADDLLLIPHPSTYTCHGRTSPAGRGIIRQDGAWTWWSDPERAASWVADGVCCLADNLHGQVIDAARALAGAGQGSRILCAGSEAAADALVGAGGDVRAAPAWMDGAGSAWADVVIAMVPGSGDRPWSAYDRASSAVFQADQRAVLAAAIAAVRPDGAVIYATSSLVPAETQAVAHLVDGWRLRGESLVWPDGFTRGGYLAVLVRA